MINNNIQSQDSRKVSKRKCEFPIDNVLSKQRKINSNSNVLSKSKSSQSIFNPISNNEDTKIQTNIIMSKGKIFKTQYNDKSIQPRPKTPSKNKNTSSLMVNKFTEGCLNNSLSTNLRKIIEHERQLDTNLKKLHSMNEDTKIKILNEFVKKNLELLELEGLTKLHHQYKTMTEEKKKTSADSCAKITAVKENVIINLERSKKVIEDIQTKQIHMQSKINLRGGETVREEEKVNKLFFFTQNLV
jgi:hypothetical protein